MLAIFLIAFVFAEDKQIIGVHPWKGITEFAVDSPEYKNSLAVGRVTNEQTGGCMGTNLGSGIVITANHCNGKKMQYNKSPCIVSSIDAGKDLLYLQCEGLDDPPSKINISRQFTKNIYVLHIQCNFLADPYCKETMKYSPGEAFDHGIFIYHNADTLPGSSGAPIFSSDHLLIGIHHGSLGDLNVGSFID